MEFGYEKLVTILVLYLIKINELIITQAFQELTRKAPETPLCNNYLKHHYTTALHTLLLWSSSEVVF